MMIMVEGVVGDLGGDMAIENMSVHASLIEPMVMNIMDV